VHVEKENEKLPLSTEVSSHESARFSADSTVVTGRLECEPNAVVKFQSNNNVLCFDTLSPLLRGSQGRTSVTQKLRRARGWQRCSSKQYLTLAPCHRNRSYKGCRREKNMLNYEISMPALPELRCERSSTACCSRAHYSDRPKHESVDSPLTIECHSKPDVMNLTDQT
jgi:hypothetical protein